MRNLIVSPAWQEAELGNPLPDSPHATSTAMPLWSHVVGYEEGDEAVTHRLQCGYPRFFRHPAVGELLDELGLPQGAALPFPSEKVARRAAAFVGDQAEAKASGRGHIWTVTVPTHAYKTLWAYWQHTGEIVSSRLARAALKKHQPGSSRQAHAALALKVADLAGVVTENVWLYPTGMASITAAFRAVRALKPNRPTVQFGFPYVDTLKLQEKMGDGVLFLPAGDGSDIQLLARRLDALQPAALFCESPTNPLLHLPDLAALSAILQPRGIALVVDNTIDTYQHVDVFPYADMVVTSLTKYFSSAGDVMGGALVLNPESALKHHLKMHLDADFEPLLFAEDAVSLCANAEGFEKRMAHIDATTQSLVARLREHPAVAALHTCGFGGLFSLELVDGEQRAPVFYDHLRCTKGPSLGTNFTLVCPYTLLAHYDELGWAADCGIAATLIRVSIGREPLEDLIHRFEAALDRAWRDC